MEPYPAKLGPVVVGGTSQRVTAAKRATCDPAQGRDALIRRLRPVEWEALLGLPLGWTDADVPGRAHCAIPTIAVSWRTGSLHEFPAPIRDLVEMLQRSHGSGPIRTSEQGHVGLEFANTPEVFGRRSGEGPLIVDHTPTSSSTTPAASTTSGRIRPRSPSAWGNRIAALRDLMTVWSWRAIQFFVQAQLDDAKRALTSDRRRQREQILDAFFTGASERAAGVRGNMRMPTTGGGHGYGPPARWRGPRARSGSPRARLPRVFLTEDRGVLRADELFAPYGIRLWRTSELLEALLDCGELTERRSLCGVVADNHGTTHLMRGVATDYAQRLAALADV